MSCSTAAPSLIYFFFFFNDTATTEIYTLSLHDALPISLHLASPLINRDHPRISVHPLHIRHPRVPRAPIDRKSTRLNSSHSQISYAVFCLKKKKTNKNDIHNNKSHYRLSIFHTTTTCCS